jgi:hypothetical protein
MLRTQSRDFGPKAMFSLAGQRISKSILPISRSCLGFVAGHLYSVATQLCRCRRGSLNWYIPHLFRHQMITYLTSQGLSDAQIQ